MGETLKKLPRLGSELLDDLIAIETGRRMPDHAGRRLSEKELAMRERNSKLANQLAMMKFRQQGQASRASQRQQEFANRIALQQLEQGGRRMDLAQQQVDLAKRGQAVKEGRIPVFQRPHEHTDLDGYKETLRTKIGENGVKAMAPVFKHVEQLSKTAATNKANKDQFRASVLQNSEWISAKTLESLQAYKDKKNTETGGLFSQSSEGKNIDLMINRLAASPSGKGFVSSWFPQEVEMSKSLWRRAQQAEIEKARGIAFSQPYTDSQGNVVQKDSRGKVHVIGRRERPQGELTDSKAQELFQNFAIDTRQKGERPEVIAAQMSGRYMNLLGEGRGKSEAYNQVIQERVKATTDSDVSPPKPQPTKPPAPPPPKPPGFFKTKEMVWDYVDKGWLTEDQGVQIIKEQDLWNKTKK